MRDDERKILGEKIRTRVQLIEKLTSELLEWIAAFDDAEGWRDDGATSMAGWLAWKCGMAMGTAFDKVRVAHKLRELPVMAAAVERGELTYSKVRELTRIATVEDEATWVAQAVGATTGEVIRACREARDTRDGGLGDRPRAFYRNHLPNGMVRLEIVVSLDEAERITLAVERALADADRDADGGFPTEECEANDSAAIHRDARADADGLLAVAEAYLRGTAQRRSPTEVVVSVRPGEPARLGRSAIDDAALRRLTCDAGVVLLTEDSHGVPLSATTRVRTVPTAVDRALRQRDRHCRFPGCANRRFLDAHHVIHWVNGGPTTLANLILLCDAHHRHVHEAGVSIAMNAQQVPTFTDRRGNRIDRAPNAPGA